MATDIFGIKNNGKDTYTEEYRGETITIEAGATIKMPRSKAIGFMSTRPNGGIKVDGMGQLTRESVKALELIRAEPVETKIFVSPRNGERFLSQESMEEADAKYSEAPVVESVNGHACPYCTDTFESPVLMIGHIGRDHADDTKRNSQPSTLTI